MSAPRSKSHAQPQLRQPLIVTRPDRLQMLIWVSQMSNRLQRKILHPRSQRTSKPVTEWCRKTLLSTVKVDPRKPRFQQPTQHRLARPLDIIQLRRVAIAVQITSECAINHIQLVICEGLGTSDEQNDRCGRRQQLHLSFLFYFYIFMLYDF